MNITAREVGRNLQIIIGGPSEGDTDQERAEALAGQRVILVPPVDAKDGARIWAHYAGILFGTVDDTAENTAITMTRLALGAWWDEETPEDDPGRRTAEARWEAIEALRWAEAEEVSQLALYWQAMGGGIDVVEEYFSGGHPKAQELLLTRNRLWNVYSRLAMLTTSRSSVEESATPSPDSSNGTSTPSGTSEPVSRDAFGIARAVSAP